MPRAGASRARGTLSGGARTALAAALAGLVTALLPAAPAGAAVGDVTYFPLDSTCCEAEDIAAGADGNLWFTVPNGNKFGWITTSGEVHEIEGAPDTVVGRRREPKRITAGPDGNMWFTERGLYDYKIGRYPAFGTARAYTEARMPRVPSPVGLDDITAGPDGNVWFTVHWGTFPRERDGGFIGRVTTRGGITLFHAFPVSGIGPGYGPPPALGPQRDPTRPDRITAGPDGHVWFTARGPRASIGRVAPSEWCEEHPADIDACAITRFRTSGDPRDITLGPDGNLWFTQQSPGTGEIGRITPSGAITEFTIPDEYAHPESGRPEPRDITAGCDGNLYFTITAADRGIGGITTDGAFTGFFSTEPHRAEQITAGPDGHLWFTSDTENIGRMELCPAPSEVQPVPLRTVSVTTAGGVVWSSPPGISCGDDSPDCEASFLPETRVTLTASPSFEAAFLGWGGDCVGSPASRAGGTCELTMDTDKVVSAGFHPGSYQPDAMIRQAGETSYTGNNRYNTSAAGQMSIATARPGETRVFHVRVQNDGSLLSDAYDLEGCGSSKLFSVSYFFRSKDITRPVVRGTYVLPPSASLLSPGDARAIKVVMQMAKAGGGWVSNCLVTATSRSGFSDAWEFAGGETPPTIKVDAVRARVKVG